LTCINKARIAPTPFSGRMRRYACEMTLYSAEAVRCCDGVLFHGERSVPHKVGYGL